jgi:hypothetical protein
MSIFSFSGGRFGYSLAPYLAYPPEAYFAGFDYNGIAKRKRSWCFYPMHMGSDLVLVLIVIRVLDPPLSLFMLCVFIQSLESGFMIFISTQCNDYELTLWWSLKINHKTKKSTDVRKHQIHKQMF